MKPCSRSSPNADDTTSDVHVSNSDPDDADMSECNERHETEETCTDLICIMTQLNPNIAAILSSSSDDEELMIMKMKGRMKKDAETRSRKGNIKTKKNVKKSKKGIDDDGYTGETHSKNILRIKKKKNVMTSMFDTDDEEISLKEKKSRKMMVIMIDSDDENRITENKITKHEEEEEGIVKF